MRALPTFICDCCKHTLAQFESERWGVRLCRLCSVGIATWMHYNGVLFDNHPLVTELLDGPFITDSETQRLAVYPSDHMGYCPRILVDKWIDSASNH